MHDCDYCDADFEDEQAYLEHLRDEHPRELGPIDQKRVNQLGGGGGGFSGSGTLIVGAGLALVAIAAIYMLFFTGGGGSSAEAKPLSENGNQSLLQDVQTFESEGKEHVSSGTDVSYDTVPPVSGDHWGASEVRRAGFYEDEQPYEALVHNLEHGHVVIYYDKGTIGERAENKLRAYAADHQASWASVVVAPNPQANPDAKFVVTAWTTKMTMDSFNEDKLVAFLSEYLGRGPENPVR